jgi:hypothetical protein
MSIQKGDLKMEIIIGIVFVAVVAVVFFSRKPKELVQAEETEVAPYKVETPAPVAEEVKVEVKEEAPAPKAKKPTVAKATTRTATAKKAPAKKAPAKASVKKAPAKKTAKAKPTK